MDKIEKTLRKHIMVGQTFPIDGVWYRLTSDGYQVEKPYSPSIPPYQTTTKDQSKETAVPTSHSTEENNLTSRCTIESPGVDDFDFLAFLDGKRR